MTLGALIDLGVPVPWLKESIAALPLTGFDLTAADVDVQRDSRQAGRGPCSHEHHHHRALRRHSRVDRKQPAARSGQGHGAGHLQAAGRSRGRGPRLPAGGGPLPRGRRGGRDRRCRRHRPRPASSRDHRRSCAPRRSHRPRVSCDCQPRPAAGARTGDRRACLKGVPVAASRSSSS
ncbi:MAG: LarC family nickel insertion protein [Desulfobacterales bacterium]|nr:LarC family nickel insertion protein [Desulfobacterales bacterium]